MIESFMRWSAFKTMGVFFGVARIYIIHGSSGLLHEWTNFLHKFSFLIKHKSGATNFVADALSRGIDLLTILCKENIGLEYWMEL